MTKELKDWEITKHRRLEWTLTRKGEQLGNIIYESDYYGVVPWWCVSLPETGIIKSISEGTAKPAFDAFWQAFNKAKDEKKEAIFPRYEFTKDGFIVKGSKFMCRPVSDISYDVDLITVLLEGGFDLPDELKEPFARRQKEEQERKEIEELEKQGFRVIVG